VQVLFARKISKKHNKHKIKQNEKKTAKKVKLFRLTKKKLNRFIENFYQNIIFHILNKKIVFFKIE